MTIPITVTPEMRQAVYDADCVVEGHVFKIDNVLQLVNNTTALANAEGLIPHLYCARCGKVWLVVETPGNGYADAESKFNASLLPANRQPSRIPKPRTGPGP